MKAQRILGIATATIVSVALSIGIAGTAQAAPPPTAHAVAAAPSAVHPNEPSGQYTYNCVLTDGTSYSFSPSSNSTCNGSRLQVYIGGEMVQSLSLTSAGRVAWASTECFVALTVYSVAVVLTAGGLLELMDAAELVSHADMVPCSTSP